MGNPHKFISSGEGYGFTVFCEHCGFIIYQKNDSMYTAEQRRTALASDSGCKHPGPQFPARDQVLSWLGSVRNSLSPEDVSSLQNLLGVSKTNDQPPAGH